MLDETTARRVSAYFAEHPVLGNHLHAVCVALTGSFAFGLGGTGADVDAKVLCPAGLFDVLRQELVAAGLVEAGGEPEEEFPFVVGDYTLESLPAVWRTVQDYAAMTPLFVYGNLIYLAGDRSLLEPLVSHCRNLPASVLERESERERGAMGQALYAFLRSFQNGDPVARLLARAELVRTAMRLTFLAEGMAPPYDKHLFRLLPQAGDRGEQVAQLVQSFLAESADADEVRTYAAVAATTDWHAMYAAAGETPAFRLLRQCSGS